MKKKLFFLAFLGLALGMGVRAIAADATPAAKTEAVMTSGVQPGDCAGCHKDAKVLPKKHVATKDLAYKDCQGCHKPGEDVPGSLITQVPLWHVHALNGVQCKQCHGAGKPEPVSMTKCLACHDNKEIAQKTADLKPTNPHNSRHYGTEADCNLCHHQHKESENHCAECHKFDFKVP